MIEKTTLSNGVRVMTEEIPYVKSVATGIWVKAGSRYETEKNNGISHFIEHMMFKGTENRTAKQIANEIDKIGGQMNAFTAKECTCYYIRSLDTHFEIALDVLADMFFYSKFDSAEMEKEKGVVLEEINMYEDAPEDQVHDIFTQKVFAHSALGMPILGTAETVSALTRQDILDYIEGIYVPENVVISIAGNIKHQDAVERVGKYFGTFARRNQVGPLVQPKFHQEFATKRKETEQVHFCIGCQGIKQTDQDFYAMTVFSNLFGGSMSSRLFQKIREEHGLAYSAFSYMNTYQDTGLFGIYAGMKPSQLSRVIDLIMEEIEKVRRDGVTAQEVLDAKEQLKGSYVMGLESTSARMTSIGRSELLQNVCYEPEETLEKVDAVTMEDIDRVIQRLFNGEISAVAVGKVGEDFDLEKAVLSA